MSYQVFIIYKLILYNEYLILQKYLWESQIATRSPMVLFILISSKPIFHNI